MTDQPTPQTDQRQPLPCGAWPSPVTAALVAGKTLTLSEVGTDGQAVFWLERRPAENGRTVLMRWTQTQGVQEAAPAGADVGTRVQEYGGGAYAVDARGLVYSERSTGAVWRVPNGQPASVVGEGGGLRYADLRLDPHSDMILAVREDHRQPGEAQTALVALGGAADSSGLVLVEGADFYMSPSLSPDGSLMAWVEWTHPDMPWDATRLCIAHVQRSSDNQIRGLEIRRVLAGADGHESLGEPRWTDDGRLLVVTDRDGQWRVWEVPVHDENAGFKPYPAAEGEIGQPAWVFGQRSYQPLPDGACLFLSVREGESFCTLHAADGSSKPFPGRPEQCPVPLADGRFAWLDARFDSMPCIMVGDTAAHAMQSVQQAAPAVLDAADISCPESVWFPVGEGLCGHAFFYPPTNARARVPQDSLPPMIVQVHGGPTARAQDSFSFKVQWWTSRGFAVLDVNYGGSTGFGRAWRNRLKGQWGVVDVADCIAACDHMSRTGRIDPKRIAIRGSSAGGMTVLLALAESNLFAAGVSLYGVTDLRALAQETHKFESHYLEGLIGPWPQAESTYTARSPLNVASRIRAPILLLQGAEDKVVPPEQARSMAQALHAEGTLCVLREFPNEGHGFRREATIRVALDEELRFYGHVFGFTARVSDI
ncbi:S9 family peptidase [Acetobacter vaccinii]|uniref:S9 family peptidase n=1 Tax=Acetobacter vaccinii TaxID=2592655 RepID=A0A5C1YNA7_9PROT|nr:prolyl oligopeptidase family serine peptidase [Acetobacter vaccinii]QEO16965.1 S9 family peptidase [Acetobacter vaccinii]